MMLSAAIDFAYIFGRTLHLCCVRKVAPSIRPRLIVKRPAALDDRGGQIARHDGRKRTLAVNHRKR
jgi:hypothetical protein